MSRLEGKQSNRAWLIALAAVMLIVAAFAATEYFGIVNLIPGF